MKRLTAFFLTLVLAAQAIAAPSGAGWLNTDGTSMPDAHKVPFKTKIGLNNVDNTSDANKPISIAQAAGFAGKASSAIQRFKEDPNNVVLYRDTFEGDPQTLVSGGTRTMVPGPGVWTVGAASNQSFVEVGGRVMRAHLLPFGTGYDQINGPLTPVTAGMAMKVRLVPSYQPGFTFSKSKVGFSLTTTNAQNKRGVISFEKASGENNVRIKISAGTSNTDENLYNAGFGTVLPFEETQVVIFYKTLTHQQYWIQTARSGHPVGSERWFMLGETFMDLSASASVYPYLAHEHSGVTEFREVTVYSQWSPGNRAALFDYSRTLQGTHIPTLARDPVTNLPILAWNTGAGHVGQGMSAIRATVRLASGAWTTPATLLAAPTSPAGQCINSISNVNGVLWMVYWKSTNGSDGGVLYRRTLSINPSDGAVTLGTETALGISGSLNLNFSPIIRLASGRLMLAFHKGLDGSPNYNAYVAHSDNGGTSWTVNAIAASIPAGMNVLVEPNPVEESDGAVGLYMRNQSGSLGYSRCTNPNASTPTWSTPRPVPAIPDPYSRAQVRKMTDGQIVVIHNGRKDYRRSVTETRVGDNAVFQESKFIADWNPVATTGSVSQLAYPTLLEDGDDIIYAWTQQESGGGDLAVGIRMMTMRRTLGISSDAGANPVQPLVIEARPIPKVTIIPYSTAPVPDLSKGSNVFSLTVTANTATIGAPSPTPAPWETIHIIVTQGGVGNFTLVGWNSIYEFNGETTTLNTGAGESNEFVFRFNPIANKLRLVSFN